MQPFSEELNGVVHFLPGALQSSLYTAFVFLAVQVNRLISIVLFQNILFKGELYMPTTCQLLWSDDQIELGIKQQIHDKIKTMFNIELLTPDEEASEEKKARKRIAFATSQIRNSLRGNPLLHQHNIEYGFWRNFIGGCVLAVFLSGILHIFSIQNHIGWLQNLSVWMLVGYLVPVLLNKMFIGWYGRRYTKVLLEQFLSLRS